MRKLYPLLDDNMAVNLIELNARTGMCIRKDLVKLSSCKVLLMDFGSVRHSKKVTCTLCVDWFAVTTCQVINPGTRCHNLLPKFDTN